MRALFAGVTSGSINPTIYLHVTSTFRIRGPIQIHSTINRQGDVLERRDFESTIIIIIIIIINEVPIKLLPLLPVVF
jgi:hypothetical protein